MRPITMAQIAQRAMGDDMKKQRGVIATIWLYLAGTIALVIALTGLVLTWNHYTDGLDKKGYDRGVSETTSAYVKRDNAALQAALIAQQDAELRAKQAEDNAVQAQSYATEQYEKGVNDEKTKTAALVAAARSGAFRLQDPGKTRASAPCSAATGTSSAAAPAGTGDGQAGTGFLSETATVFLVNEASRADEVVLQLSACQAIIVSDRVLTTSGN